MDPRNKRFIEIHSDNVGSVFDQVAPFVHMPLEKRCEWIESAMSPIKSILRDQPHRREEILNWEDPRSAESEALWLRLVAEARARRGR